MNPEPREFSAYSTPRSVEVKYPASRFYVESGDCNPIIQIRLEKDGTVFLSYTPIEGHSGKVKTLSFEEFNLLFAKTFFDLDFENKPDVALFDFDKKRKY
jgi:hypothetical protein